MKKHSPDPQNDPQLPGVPYIITAETLRIARDQTLDYIAFVARNYPPQWAEEKILQGAFRLRNIVASEYEQSARELVEGAAEDSLNADPLDLSKRDLI